MALNKAQTSLATKVLIILLALSMVLFVLLPAIAPLLSGGSNTSGQQQQSTAQAGSYEAIAAKYSNTVASNDAAIKADPKNSALLINQGNLYFDWANEVQSNQALAQKAMMLPLWQQAISFYQRGIAATRTVAPGTVVDLAIATHYSGDSAKALAEVEKLMKTQPNFAPALFNAGIFAASAGDNAKAIKYFEAYLKVAPTSDTQQIAFAKQQLSTLKK
jgi:tetratricopeptide (TPR) repeat protein